MIKFEDYDIFKKNYSTLKWISRDDSNPGEIRYMTESSICVVDFDTVKRQYANQLGLSEESVLSIDGLVELSEGLSFIEFKNGQMKEEKRRVKDKIRDSLLLFCDITGKNISYTRKELDFILVYNLEKNPLPNQLKKNTVQESESRTAIAKHFLQKGNEEFVRFDLKRFANIYFRSVHTYSQEEFELYLKNCS